jgi:hypothetical protein
MSGAATAAGNQKKAKVFDEDIFLGPKKYMPRKIKSTDPYLHYDGYLYRKSSPTRYLCNDGENSFTGRNTKIVSGATSPSRVRSLHERKEI